MNSFPTQATLIAAGNSELRSISGEGWARSAHVASLLVLLSIIRSLYHRWREDICYSQNLVACIVVAVLYAGGHVDAGARLHRLSQAIKVELTRAREDIENFFLLKVHMGWGVPMGGKVSSSEAHMLCRAEMLRADDHPMCAPRELRCYYLCFMNSVLVHCLRPFCVLLR
jgi:hypothetical protein